MGMSSLANEPATAPEKRSPAAHRWPPRTASDLGIVSPLGNGFVERLGRLLPVVDRFLLPLMSLQAVGVPGLQFWQEQRTATPDQIEFINLIVQELTSN